MTAGKRTVILISGRGSNMAALIGAAAERDFPAEIVGVVSDKPDAGGLVAAQAAGIDTRVVARDGFDGKDAHDLAIDVALSALGAEIVCLAGYMRLLTPDFVSRWVGRMINIHPALLPAHKGLDTHRRALADGVRIHGCTVHFVATEVDAGPIIAQAAVPVLSDDTEATLAARVLKAEHRIYPMALKLVAEGSARIEGGRVVFVKDGVVEAADTALLMSPVVSRVDVDVQALARVTPEGTAIGRAPLRGI